jgi:hypothetical protein
MPDAQTIGIYVASAAVVVTGTGVIDQWRRGRRAEGNDFLMRLVDTWESKDVRSRRSRVAADLLEQPPIFTRYTLDIFNFFEILAYLVRSGSVRADGAWNLFSMFAVGYWFAGGPEIDRQREDDPTVFEEYEHLIDRFGGIEARERRKTPTRLKWKPEDVAAFLRNEKELAGVIPPPTLPDTPASDPPPSSGAPRDAGSPGNA